MIVSRREKVRVGLFVILAGALAIGVALALAGLTTKPMNVYCSTFEESVSGLDEASPVKYQGKYVGKVQRIGIDPETLLPLVEYAVAVDTPIREDTVATLVVQSYASGLRYVELSKGSPRSPFRAPGTRIPSQPSAFTQLDRVIVSAEEALTSGRDLMASLDRGVATATARINPTMDGVDRSVAALERTITEGGGILADNRSSVREAIEELRASLAVLHEVAASAEREEVMVRASAALGSMNHAADALARVAERIDGILGRNVESIEEIVANLRSTSRDLAEAAREIKERPALLIRDVPRGAREVPGE